MTRTVDFHFNGRRISAQEGQTVAMALWVAGIRALRTSPVLAEPRGFFCGMGVCQECALWIDGRRRESCLTVVCTGMSVTSQ